MANKRKINTYALWDNFKRDIDWELKKVKALSLKKKLDAFNRPPYRPIQDLLELTCKWLCKIAIAHLWEKGAITEDNISEFSFYVWPGYDTLRNRNRVFMNGSKIQNRRNQNHYFTGIGSSKIISVVNIDKFARYLEGTDSIGFRNKKRHFEPVDACKWDGEFFFHKDTPSTLAFDHCLNPLNTGGFTPPSTHFWKVNQKDNAGNLIPIRLSDHTELRFLHISTKAAPDSGDGILHISLDDKNLTNSGHEIAGHFSRNKSGLWFIDETHQNEFKSNFVQWPNTSNADPQFHHSRLDCYSYWISETLGRDSQDYSALRTQLRKSGLEEIAERIRPFNYYKQQNPENFSTFYPATYNHWYTLYFDGYDAEVDLGSIMLLSSHDLNGQNGILRDCWQWIRWVFNELRLIEANTTQEFESFQINYSILSHNIDFHLKYSNNLLKDYDLSRHNLHAENLMHLSELLDFSVNYNSLNKHIQQKIDFDETITVSLSEKVRSVLGLIQNDIQNNNGRLLKLNTEQVNSIRTNQIYKISSTISQDDKISTIPEVLSLLLKDIISNAVKNNFHNGTYCSPVEIKIENSDSDCYLIEIVNNTEFPKSLMNIFNEDRPLINLNGLGLQIIKQISKSTNYKIDVSTEDDCTKFRILLPFLISTSS